MRGRCSFLFGLLLLAASCACSSAPAQGQPDTSTVDDGWERSLEDLALEAEAGEQLSEMLAQLSSEPLDVNAASASDLALIPAISPLLAARIVRHRRKEGPFRSLPTLRAVEGITQQVFLDARPYLTIGKQIADPVSPYPAWPSLRQLTHTLEFEFIQRADRRLDLGRGYDRDSTRQTYLGSPEKLYTRLRAQSDEHLQLTLALEKDPGERFTWDPATHTYGYDHLAGHFALKNVGRIQTLVVGDFVANYGQGLSLWRRGAFGKGRDPIRAVVRSGSGLKPYGSRAENSFFRGAAATVSITPALTLSGWASRRQRDATLTSLGAPADTTRRAATSLVESGYHRTPTELAKKDALGESLVGGAAELELAAGRVGLVAYHSRFDDPLRPGTRPYERYDVAGQRFLMGSLYGHAVLGNLYVVGEAGRSPGGAVGGLVGGVYEAARGVDVALLARHYPRHFASLYGYAFGERSGAPQNETGLYLGLRLRPSRAWTVSAYIDQYRFPWLRFGVPRPSNGYEARLVIEHAPRPWFSYYVQGHTETRETGTEVVRPTGPPVVLKSAHPRTRQSLRLHGTYHFSEALRMRARLEGTRYDEADAASQHGVLLYQDLRWAPAEKLRLDLRLAFFDAEGYAARIYAYENDLLYAFAIPAFFGRGQRFYALLTATPLPNVKLELKYAVTRYEQREAVGSGLRRVSGNRLRAVRGQLRWTF